MPKFLSTLKALYQRSLVSMSVANATRVQFFRAHRRILNLSQPKTFSEKICTAKLKWTDERFVTLSDKLLVKDWVRERVGKDFVIPTLYSGKRLPPRALRTWKTPYVIKANHGSGMLEFLREASDVDWDQIEQRVANWDGVSWPSVLSEEWYNQIERQILIEPIIGQNGVSPDDYKFFVFRGKIACIQIDSDRFGNHCRDFYDANWKELPFKLHYPKSEKNSPPLCILAQCVW